MKLLTSYQMKEIEEYAINNLLIPSLLLMENAAIGVFDECIKFLENKTKSYIVIFCGKGNNGGDGLALARQLFIRKFNVLVYFSGDIEKATQDCKKNYDIAKSIQVPIVNIDYSKDMEKIKDNILKSDIVVDSLIGTGLKNDLSEEYKKIINLINKYSKYTISIDCPTGLNADSGKINGACIKADKTVTFYLPKIGLILPPGNEYTGTIVTKDISIPHDIKLIDSFEYNCMTDKEIKNLIPKRISRSNKGTFGKVFIFAGSKQMPGACFISSYSCFKSGCGYVKACAVKPVADIINILLPEAVTTVLPDKDGCLCVESFEKIKDDISKAKSIILGPGIGISEETKEFVKQILLNSNSTIILDADGLNNISDNPGILKEIKGNCIITPHPGEMSRLTGIDIKEIMDNMIETAKKFASEYNVITVLKDSKTIIASPQGEVYINTTGNSALAKAGSGDSLSGIIASFSAQGCIPMEAAILGTYINGKAGFNASENLSEYGVLARDTINKIPKVIKYLTGLKN